MQRKNDQVSFCTKSALICTGEDVHVVENALLFLHANPPVGKTGFLVSWRLCAGAQW